LRALLEGRAKSVGEEVLGSLKTLML